MVDIPIKELRQLHYDSDMLRNIFFDIADSSEGNDDIWYKEKDHLTRDDLESAKEYILRINRKIIDLDVETPNETSTFGIVGLTEALKSLTREGKLIEILMKYHGEHEFTIEYGDNASITIRKYMPLSNDDYFIYYYDPGDETVPLGAIAIDSITAIKIRR